MKIICIGRNYADHAKELNNEIPSEPVIFCKGDNALIPAKAFDFSAPLGKKYVKNSDLPDPKSIKFEMKKNGETVQEGDSSLMLFTFDHLISEVSKYFTLKMGDLIFTGTPKGVGPVQKGDLLEGYLEGEKLINLKVK